MAKVIQPKRFLLQLKIPGFPNETTIHPTDFFEITELNLTIPVIDAVQSTIFYDRLKKAVSDFNSDAALNGKENVDFDDLYTRYSEYIEALVGFIKQLDNS